MSLQCKPLSCLCRFELPEGMQRDKFLETEQVAWVTLQPREGLPLKVTPLDPPKAPLAAPQSRYSPPATPTRSETPQKRPGSPLDS